jgi:hypothetical protein
MPIEVRDSLQPLEANAGVGLSHGGFLLDPYHFISQQPR